MTPTIFVAISRCGTAFPIAVDRRSNSKACHVLRAFPVAIDTAAYARVARNAMRRNSPTGMRDSLGDRRLILGVDRLDYSKGIPDRIQAFGHFLDT